MILVVLASLVCTPHVANGQGKTAPLKVLLVAGGCCHDYPAQSKILKAGIEKLIHAEVTVEFNDSANTETRFEIYESDDWAKGYDVVLHDECSANVTDIPYVRRILAAHRSGTPAVNLHCAMHSYRWGAFREPVKKGADNAGWYEMIGLQSTGHGPKSPIDVSFAKGNHPITKGMKAWTTVDEELYNNVQVFGNAQVLASGKQLQMPRVKKGQKRDPNAKGVMAEAAVIWTNLYGPNKTRIFSTSLGHMNETVADDRYLNLVVRGLLWSSGHLSKNGKIESGYAK
jgi:type 1 glutamine amidotransferase